jgi:hypothetical protein
MDVALITTIPAHTKIAGRVAGKIAGQITEATQSGEPSARRMPNSIST